MKLVVDASAAIRWHVQHRKSEAALTLRTDYSAFAAPELILAEIGSALWKYVRAGEITPENALAVIAIAPAPFERLVPTAELAADALRLAIRLDHSFYDCLYVALAGREGIPLATADRKLANAAAAAGGIEVRLI